MVPVVNAHILLQFGTQKKRNVNNVQNKSVISITQVNNVFLVLMIYLTMITSRKHAESALTLNLNLTKILDTVRDVIMRNLIWMNPQDNVGVALNKLLNTIRKQVSVRHALKASQCLINTLWVVLVATSFRQCTILQQKLVRAVQKINHFTVGLNVLLVGNHKFTICTHRHVLSLALHH